MPTPRTESPASEMTHIRSCHLCEASCGVRITVADGRITDVRGDADDPLSRGYVCPKVTALADVHQDPDRLRTPLRRGPGGSFEPIEWDDAFDLVANRLREIRRTHGPDALAVYQGNPVAHNFGLLTFGQLLFRRLGTRNLYSATSADQLPHMLAALLMFGNQLRMPVPDLDRTDYFLVLGANPAVSNGSLMTAPDVRRRLRELRARGGQLVVVDPRRTETAHLADRHLFIRPGTDALLLLAVLDTLFSEDRVRPGRLAQMIDAAELARLGRIAADFSPERVAGATGIDAGEIRRLARELSAARRAVVYGRIGACTQEFGGLTAWLINLVNVATGNLDREGGAMFTTPAADVVALAERMGMRGSFDRYRSRVSDLPEFGGELPVAALAEEMETPGPEQIRALITCAGNPVLSTPNGARLERALRGLEFHVAIDFYRNETSRLADVILPPTFALERDQFEIAMHVVGTRNAVRYDRALFPRAPDQRHDWEICLELASRLEAPAGMLGRPVAAALRAAGRRIGPRGIAALGVRLGPWRRRAGLTMRRLERAEHGVDLGPLEPRLPDALGGERETIALVPEAYAGDLPRLRARLEELTARAGGGELVLIGRRHLRSNNSWLHNSERLVKGKPRCTLLVHPDDAARLGVEGGGSAWLRSRVGAEVVPVEITGDIMPGVVSLPHGWGHGRAGVGWRVAAAHPGASINDVTDERHVDRLTGTAGLSGVPVVVEPAAVWSAADESVAVESVAVEPVADEPPAEVAT